MNESSARLNDELDLEALARGDRVAAGVLVELSRGARAYVLEPDVFAALTALSKTRSHGAGSGKLCWLNCGALASMCRRSSGR